MSEENSAGQQTVQPTGQAAGAQAVPVQSAQQQTPPVAQATTAPADATDWKKRYTGLQAVHQQTVENARAIQADFEQQAQHASTLESQLGELQVQVKTLAEAQAAKDAQLAALQTESNYWSLISTEFPDLTPIAANLQRVPDPDQQRAILTSVRSAVTGQIAQQATQVVAQSFTGIVPGSAPAPNQASSQFPPKEVIIEKLATLHPRSKEYQEVKAIWDIHPENGPQTLHPEFVDPMRNDWDIVRKDDRPAQIVPQTMPNAMAWRASGGG